MSVVVSRYYLRHRYEVHTPAGIVEVEGHHWLDIISLRIHDPNVAVSLSRFQTSTYQRLGSCKDPATCLVVVSISRPLSNLSGIELLLSCL